MIQYISEEEDVFVVAYTSKDSDAYQVLKEVNEDIEDVKFFVVSEPEVMAEYHQSPGTIMIMKTFDDKTSYFKETLTKEKLTIFIQREILPLVIEFSQENAFKIFESPIQKHFIFMSDKADKGHKDTLRDVSQLYIYYTFLMKYFHGIFSSFVFWPENTRRTSSSSTAMSEMVNIKTFWTSLGSKCLRLPVL